MNFKSFRFPIFIIFYLKAQQRVDSSFSAVSRALLRIPDIIDRVRRTSQEPFLNPSAQDTGGQGEEPDAEAGQRSVTPP